VLRLENAVIPINLAEASSLLEFIYTHIDVCDTIGNIPHAQLKLAVHQFWN
jgi:hypothetical protein